MSNEVGFGDTGGGCFFLVLAGVALVIVAFGVCALLFHAAGCIP